MTKEQNFPKGIRFKISIYNVNDIAYLYYNGQNCYVHFNISDGKHASYHEIEMTREFFEEKEKEFSMKKYGEIL